MDLGDIAALLTAGGVGGVVAKWIGDTGLRRAARAELLAAFIEVEKLAWDEHFGERAEAIVRMERAALIANLPRRVMEQHVEVLDFALNYMQDEIYLVSDQTSLVHMDSEEADTFASERMETNMTIIHAQQATSIAIRNWLWHPYLSIASRWRWLRRSRVALSNARMPLHIHVQ